MSEVQTTPEQIEPFAIRLALGNNGGTWAEHYTEEQKEHWRQFVRDLVREVRHAGKGEAVPTAAGRVTRC